MKYKLLIALFFIFLVSCNVTKEYYSKTYTKQEKQKDFFYSLYDSDSKTGYSIFNDSNAIQIIICTKEPKSIINILKGGLTFYFNLEGEKKKDLSISYPIQYEDLQIETASKNDEKNKIDNVLKDGLDAMILKLPREARITKFKQKSIVALDSLYGFEFDIQNNVNHGLVYKIQIPYSFFNYDFNSNQPFVLGIKAEDIFDKYVGDGDVQNSQFMMRGNQNSMSTNPYNSYNNSNNYNTNYNNVGYVSSIRAFNAWHLIRLAP